MKLNKRNCDTRIRLTPCSAYFQKIQWSIGGDHHILWPSAVMAGQFSDFLDAVYRLYSEGIFDHGFVSRIQPNKGPHPMPCWRSVSTVKWDEEGSSVTIRFVRRHNDPIGEKAEDLDLIDIELYKSGNKFCYCINGKDLCYAIAKACTETIKKYGFMGYCFSSDDSCRSGESIDLNKLLFVKAYALGNMEARELRLLWREPKGWMSAHGSSLKKEIELLLFDM